MKNSFDFAGVKDDVCLTSLKVPQTDGEEAVGMSRFSVDDREAVVSIVNSETTSIHRSGSERVQAFEDTRDSSPLRVLSEVTNNHSILDGLASEKGLVTVLFRVFAASSVYAFSSSLLVASLVASTRITLWGLGPVEMAVLHSLSVAFFVIVMVPFAILLAWIYRYRKPSPYQKCTVAIDLSYCDTFQLAVAAGMTVTGCPVRSLDYHAGTLTWELPRRNGFSDPQELAIRIEKNSNDQSTMTINTSPVVNPIEYILFGYTLTVDGARSSSILESFLTFLELNML